MATAGALEHPELMSEGKNLSLQRCASLKGLPSRRKQRENDRHHVAEKLQRRLHKFNRFSQNVVFGRDNWFSRYVLSWDVSVSLGTSFCLAALGLGLTGGKAGYFRIKDRSSRRNSPVGWRVRASTSASTGVGE